MGVLQYSFYSNVLGQQVNTMLILPSYLSWRDKGEYKNYYENYGRKKTLYVCHGGSDDCSLYLRKTKIEDYADQGDFAVVFPEVNNSYYSNMVHGKDYFTYLSEELPKVLEANFPIATQSEDRYVIGNSMGSHGAFKWALNRPDFFAAAAGMSGVGDLVELGFYKKYRASVFNAFGTVEEFKNSPNDFKYLAKKLLEEHVLLPRYYSCCGTEDFTYEGTKLFAEYTKKIGFPMEYETGPGAHTWEFWDHWLPILIDKMMKGGR